MAPARRPAVSIVLPAFNEEANIEQAVAEATATAERLFAEHEVIVVDDGSARRAPRRSCARSPASDPRVRLISHGRNRGYGEALRTGFLASRLDFVFFTDADLQFDMNELERFLPYAGTVDVVAGYRVNRQDPLARRPMAYAWNLLVRVLFYVPVRDIDCAFKLFDRRVLDDGGHRVGRRDGEHRADGQARAPGRERRRGGRAPPPARGRRGARRQPAGDRHRVPRGHADAPAA